MSVWSAIEGTISVPKICRHGIKELMQTHFPDMGRPYVEYLSDYNDRRVFKVSLNIDYEGFSAAKRIEAFVKECYTHNIGVALDVTVRY